MKYVLLTNYTLGGGLYRYNLETGVVSTLEKRLVNGEAVYTVKEFKDDNTFCEVNFLEVISFRAYYDADWFRQLVEDSNFNLMHAEELNSVYA